MVFKFVLLSFIMTFVAIYGIVSYAMYIDDKTFHQEGIWDFFGSILVLVICSFLV